MDGDARAYGFGLSRDWHIAFSAAYLAVLLTIAGYGAARFVANPPAIPLLNLMRPAAKPVAFRQRPVPDPAFPHRIAAYPHVALLNHQEGTIILRVLVLRSGEVGDVVILRSSGYPQLDAAALTGVGEWRYLPAVRNGVPESAEIDTYVRFHLRRL